VPSAIVPVAGPDTEGIELSSGQLRFVLLGSGGRGASSEISTWVAANGTPVQSVGNGTLYHLSAAIGGV
jgi:hypothetical protein